MCHPRVRDAAKRYANEFDALGRWKGSAPVWGASHSGDRRWLKNEDAIRAELASAAQTAGLKYVEASLEGASLASQVALFAGAACVVVQHGSAICNCLRMSPGTALVELGPPTLNKYQDDCHFQSMVEAMGVRWLGCGSGQWQGGTAVDMPTLREVVGLATGGSAKHRERAAAYVATELAPTLSPALVALCRARPANPVRWLALYLQGGEDAANAARE